MKDYYICDSKWLKERNPKWLQDDYVKFIRWGQWRIETTGAGILGFITNHGYLDNPTFRGMRQQLMNAFSQIYILDLHGNYKKKERSPDGSMDENVFDIQQGVAIGIFVKEPGKAGLAEVYHADLWGLRENKYRRLLDLDIETTPWELICPESPFFLFAPRNTRLLSEYEQGWKITEIMPINGVGMTTARDKIVIDFETKPIIERALIFRDSPSSDKEVCSKLGIPLKKGWNVSNARKLIRQVADLNGQIKPILYRPFDIRLIFYHDSLVWRTVKQVMRHLLAAENFGLIVPRQIANKFRHVFCTKNIINFNALDTAGRFGSGCLFPLYLYPPVVYGKADLINGSSWQPGQQGRVPNLNPKFVAELSTRLKLDFISDGFGDLQINFGPKNIFDYIYAIFHSKKYRDRYAEFLKTDFPRVPLISDQPLFRKLCTAGKELIALHVLESQALSNLITTYPIRGNDQVGKGYPKYFPLNKPDSDPVRSVSSGRVYINKDQYFEGVPHEVWKFQVGGYQVSERWLKDRKGRTLLYDELNYYQKIIVALNETIRLMQEIDEAIISWPIQ